MTRRIFLVVVVLLLSQQRSPSFTLGVTKWSLSPPPTFFINPVNFSNLSADAVESDLKAALDAWGQTGSAFTFVFGGRVSDTSVVQGDGKSVLIFRDSLNPDNSSSLGSARCWARNGIRTDCDITIWRKRHFTGSAGCVRADGTKQGWYIVDIATHEYGHAVGVQHSTLRPATMYPSASKCDMRLRSLDADDITAMRTQYP